MSTTSIEWTQQTWNPIAGCSIVSPGCHNCYAMRTAARLEAMGQAKYAGTTKRVNGKTLWTGKVNLDESALSIPLRTKKPTMFFVNSMSDLFHEAVPDEFIDKVFAVMALCPQHTFQVLTKRATRLPDYLAYWITESDPSGEWSNPLPNLWLGVSVENQAAANERIPWLLQTPAAVRFISAEPLLGPLDLMAIGHNSDGWPAINALSGERRAERGPKTQISDGSKVDWVIVGGESGPNARPMHPNLARPIRDQCVAAGVPFFFKQWGEWLPAMEDGNPGNPRGQEINCSDKPIRVGKKAAGRLLDGREWNEMPETA